MADMTVENADLDERGKAQMRAQRYRQIDQVAVMLKADGWHSTACRNVATQSLAGGNNSPVISMAFIDARCFP